MKIKALFAAAAAVSLLLFTSCSSICKTTSGNDSTTTAKRTMITPLPYGTADIKGRFIKVTEDNNAITCIMQVEEIEGYGASTPQVAVNSEIEVVFPPDFNQIEKLKETVSVRISRFVPAGSSAAYWSFVKFN